MEGVIVENGGEGFFLPRRFLCLVGGYKSGHEQEKTIFYE